MKTVLKDLGSIPQAQRIILIAHSMGTYALTAALKELALEQHPVTKRISTIILAAPNIDKATFVDQIAPQFLQMPQANFTIYTSSKDTALKASRAVWGDGRLGDSTDGPLLLNGFETVDATGAESDFFGHTYFGDNPTIIEDISDIVVKNMSAKDRPLLRAEVTDAGTFWPINLAK